MTGTPPRPGLSRFPAWLRLSRFPAWLRLSRFPAWLRLSRFPAWLRLSRFPAWLRLSRFPGRLRLPRFPGRLRLRSLTVQGWFLLVLGVFMVLIVVAAVIISQLLARSIQGWVYLSVLAAFLLAAVAMALVLREAVVVPLDRLGAASRLVVRGDFGRRISPGGPADLRDVAADVEAMRGALAAALDGARAAQDTATRQAADLDAQAAELRRSNAELEQFAYVASHDLQEPLRKIASFCQLLEQRYGDQLDDRGRQYIGFAVDGAKRMQALINDLLAFSRVGRAGEPPVRVPVAQPLEAAVAALGAAFEDSGATIERPGHLPEVLGEPTLLTMLWQNLIGNAIKFRAPDRVPAVRITVTEQPAGTWEFCVADNGIGIPPEFADKVFVIFQRLHGRDTYPGTGIGLALCKRIVEHHGGGISLDSSYDGGARICFTLPRIEVAPPDQAEPGAPASREGITA